MGYLTEIINHIWSSFGIQHRSSVKMKSLVFALAVFIVVASMADVEAILQSLGPKMGQGDETKQLKDEFSRFMERFDEQSLRNGRFQLRENLKNLDEAINQEDSFQRK